MTASTPASLHFTLIPTEETWTIIGPVPDRPPRIVPSPLADTQLRGLVASLREWASRPVPWDRPDPLGTEAFVRGLARRISQRLTEALLADEDRRSVAAALAGSSRARLVLRVRPASEGTGPAADATLALPWELLSPEGPGLWPVQDGRLAVIREAVADGAPDLSEPAGPFTLAAAIAAPEDRVAFAYEQEAFRLLAALSPLGQRAVFSDLGGLEDLVELVAAIRATAIHFRGHGLPGGLLFENALGFAEEVPVGELRRRLATILLSPRRVGSFPGLFFLAAPYTAREAQPGQGPEVGAFLEESSSAAALHRSGFAQVVGYFGPVSADLTTRLEERFYESLARGGSTLAAVELARSALDEPLGAAGERVVYPFGWTQLAVYHRGPDRPLAQPGRGTRLPVRFRRRMVQVHGLPVLERGFIGRRDLLHEIRRRIHEGQRLLVLQGLGGLGKTALASHLLARIFEVKPADRLILRCQEAEDAADPVLALRGQAEDHGRLHRFRFWDERMRDLRERFPDPMEGFVEVVRALRRDRPHLAIYADNAESLQEGPKTGDSRVLGTWRPGAEAWWRALEQLEAEGDGLIALTTRYLWSDLGERAWVGIGSMGPADSLRMIDSFPSLARLPREVRTRIAEQVDGHPRTVEYLDHLVAWQRRKLGRKKLRDPWRELIEPVLPKQAEQITADLLLEEIWQRLSERAQAHAKKIGVLRIPAPQFVIDQLGETRDELVRSGLLTRYRTKVETDIGVVWSQEWGFHSLVRELASQAAVDEDRMTAHREAGTAFEAWLRDERRTWSDHEEAIHHLFAVGEGDRAWPLVQTYSLRLRTQARFREALKILECCESAGVRDDRLARTFAFISQMLISLGEHGKTPESVLQQSLALARSDQTRSLILHEQGLLFYERGRYRDAEDRLRQALAIQESSGEVDPHPIGATLHALAVVLSRRSQLTEASALLRKAHDFVVRSVGKDHPDSAATLHVLAGVLEKQGHLAEAEGLLQRAAAVFSDRLGDGHPKHNASLHALAGVLANQGRYLEAENLLRRALSADERALGPSHPNCDRSMHALAEVLAHQGFYGKAEELLRRSLSSSEQRASTERLEIASSLHALAGVLESQDRYVEAERLLRRSLEISEQFLGTSHPAYGKSLHNLACILEDQGRYAEAEELVQRSLRILEQAEERDPSARETALQTLAKILERLGRYEEAEALFRLSLEMTSESLGENHPTYSLGIDGLAGNLRKQGRYAEAERFLRQALQIDEETLGSDHPSYAASLAGLATALEAQGRYLESEELLRRALPIFEKTLGPRHSSYGACLHNLADTLLRQGRLDEAEHLLRESLAIKVQVLGEGHPSLSTTLHALAKVLEGQGRYRDSEEVLVRALTLVENTLGPRHPSYGASLHNLTSVLQRQGRLTEAEAVLSEALALFDQTLGAEHPSHATAQHTLAGLYMLQTRWQEAEELLWRSLGAIEKSLGAVHPNLAPTLTNLATVLARQGRAPESEPLLRRALEIVQNAYGPQSSDKAQVLVTLAQVQHLTGQACAVVTAREAREALFESLGAEHPVTRNALEILEGIGCEETGPTT